MEIEGKDSGNSVKVVCNANRRILSMDIYESILKVRSKEEIQQIIMEATNVDLTKSEAIFLEESKRIMPNIPGISNIF
ncbi:MAG: YbaB/EbfC family nucleoid-associated protein [Solitalea-like symbiont of Acarus siro]